MKTRRIFLNPGEPVEIVNAYGTSVLKATASFDGTQPCVVLYEQPGVITINSAEAKTFDLSLEPIYSKEPQVPEQFSLLEEYSNED